MDNDLVQLTGQSPAFLQIFGWAFLSALIPLLLIGGGYVLATRGRWGRR